MGKQATSRAILQETQRETSSRSCALCNTEADNLKKQPPSVVPTHNPEQAFMQEKFLDASQTGTSAEATTPMQACSQPFHGPYPGLDINATTVSYAAGTTTTGAPAVLDSMLTNFGTAQGCHHKVGDTVE